MFQTYEEIFRQRADAYHSAMEMCPHARDHEFRLAVERVTPETGQEICDAPAGGGYLRSYLPDTVGYCAIETAPDFAARCPIGPRNRTVTAPLERIPLPDDSADGIISLAGVHHLPDKVAFFEQAARIIKPGGRFVLADVEAGTPTDKFLNGYVDARNSMGHDGAFLTEETRDQLRACGLDLIGDDTICYPWSFPDEQTMGRFCRLLFGIDQAREADVIEAIGDILGYCPGPDRINMKWSLSYITCRVGCD